MATAPEATERYGDRHHSSRDYDRDRRHRDERDGGGHRDRDRERDRERYESRRHSERDRDPRDRDRERYGRGGGASGGSVGREDYEEYARRHREDDHRRRERRGDDDHGHRRPPRDDDRGERRGRGRHRDALGTPERRSPTPPDAVPLSQRKRKASGWDVHAPGYEQYTAMQAKQTGECRDPPYVLALARCRIRVLWTCRGVWGAIITRLLVWQTSRTSGLHTRREASRLLLGAQFDPKWV
ncbi:hypothetical protein BV20DRAFT_613301 [Pilatotrama ljubarskyi]|nr:hypothetical protein BV20DRAFT_613301 [Pilatotrama ljubarskyi]